MIKVKFFLAILLITGCPAVCQVPGVPWANKVVGGNSKSLGIDPLGNVYTLGNIGPGTFIDVDPGPGVTTLYGDDGGIIIYKFNASGEFVWAKQLTTNVTAECIRADAAQNVYLIGHFGLTNDFDPGLAVFNLTSQGQNDVFILKLDMNGNFIWAKSFGGPTANLGLSLAVGDNGNVYSTGYFQGTCDFDPGPGVLNLTAGFPNSFFVALNAAGDLLWAQQIAGGFNQGYSITTNSIGDLIIGGIFTGTQDLNPGAGVFTASSSGSGDIFILKLNGAGGFVWARTLGGPGSDQDESVALDPAGNVYVTGSFKLTADVDPGPGVLAFTAAGTTDIFVLKLGADGSFIWAKQLGGPLADIPKDISVDTDGNVYTTGIFQDMADFDPGGGVYNLNSNGSNDAYISKLNTDGSFGWAVGFGSSTSEDKGDGVAAGATGAVYLAGTFLGSVDFDPGPGSKILVTSIQSNFLMKFSGQAQINAVVSIADGNWNDAAIWSGGTVPTSSNSVTVKHTVTLSSDREVYSLSIEKPNGNLVVQTGANLKVVH